MDNEDLLFKDKKIVHIPDYLMHLMENYFGFQFNGLHFYESDTLRSYHALAYTCGDEIHFQKGLFRFNGSTRILEAAMLGHELTHVIQQSFLNEKQYLYYDFQSLEEEAYYHAFRIIITYRDLLEGEQSQNNPNYIMTRELPLLNARKTKHKLIQTWQVGGWLSSVNQNVLVFNGVSNWFRKWDDKRFDGLTASVYVSQIGVHEEFTLSAVKRLKGIFQNRATIYSYSKRLNENEIQNLVFGSRFNDVGMYSNGMFATIYTIGSGTFEPEQADNTIDKSIMHSMKKKLLPESHISLYWTGRAGIGKDRDLFRYIMDSVGKEKAKLSSKNIIFPYKDEYIEQTHKGCMQFLHSMDTSGGNLEYNKKKVLRWAEFCLNVYENKSSKSMGMAYVLNNDSEKITYAKFQEMKMLAYLLRLDEDDILVAMLLPLMIKYDLYETVKEELPDNNEMRSMGQDEILELEKRKVRIIKNRYLYNEHVIQKNTSIYGKVQIGTFFGGMINFDSPKILKDIKKLEPGLIALGTVCHMIQDSFAASHSKRVYNIYEGIKTHEELACQSYLEENMSYVNLSADQTDSRMNVLRERLLDNITPIIQFTDYTNQSSDRHAYADNLIESISIEDSKDLTKEEKEETKQESRFHATHGAVFARDCTAHFLYLAFLKGKDVALQFVDQVYKLPQNGTFFKPSAGGYQYESFFDIERTGVKIPSKMKSLFSDYEKETLTTIAQNKIEKTGEERIKKYEKHLSIISKLIITLLEKDKTNSQTLDILKGHADEILLELIIIMDIYDKGDEYDQTIVGREFGKYMFNCAKIIFNIYKSIRQPTDCLDDFILRTYELRKKEENKV